MLTKTDITNQLKSAKKHKSVSWADGCADGQMRKESNKEGVAASNCKKDVYDEVKQLEIAGYSDVEAASIAGISFTPKGTMFGNPIFYDTKEQIDARRDRERLEAPYRFVPIDYAKKPIESNDIYNSNFFFKISVVGTVAAAVVVGAAVVFSNGRS